MGAPISRLSNSNGTAESSLGATHSKTSSKKSLQTKSKLIQNANKKFVVVWLDSNFNDSDVIYRNSITRLQRISVSINPFNNINDCISFVNKMQDAKILMVIAEDLMNE